jgi:hypothetical protein
MTTSRSLGHTPYYFLSRRPFREERLLSYIRREHRRGRRFADILDDPYVRRCGSPQLVWATLRDTRLIELLDADIREELEQAGRAVEPS